MMPGRWRMQVTFDDPEKVPGAMEYWQHHGRKEMREFVAFLAYRWGLDDREDFYDTLSIHGPGSAGISDADCTVTATQDVIDDFSGIHEWLIATRSPAGRPIMHTSPVRIVFERVGERA